MLKQDLPAEQVEEALRKRLLTDESRMDIGILVDFFEKYGVQFVPFIEEHLSLFQYSERLLSALKQLDDDSYYWRLFFKISTQSQWNNAL
ncbi:MAG: hypothetical protein ACPGWR_06660 [Ardenticatenaceae bacterium]